MAKETNLLFSQFFGEIKKKLKTLNSRLLETWAEILHP